MVSSFRSVFAVFALFLLSLSGTARADSAETDSIEWTSGPGTGTMGRVAEIALPEGFIFADGHDTRTIMESMENLVSDQEVGFVATEEFDWFVVFEFDPVGYVKDDDKDALDADKLMTSIRESSKSSNEERRRRGWRELTVLG